MNRVRVLSGWMAVAALTMATATCTAITHARNYGVGTWACLACPPLAGVRQPPCPPASAGGGDGTLTFALRSIDLGADPATWRPGYLAGLNRDCGIRNGGVPFCNPGEPGWTQLPDGVDNALGQGLSSLLTDPTLGLHFPVQVNDGLTQGLWAAILVLDHWNGLPDDDSIGARLLFGGAQGAPPRFDGSDAWSVYSDGADPSLPSLPDTLFKGGAAYVTGGVFVWDLTGVTETHRLKIRNAYSAACAGSPSSIGAWLNIDALGAVLIGDLTSSGLRRASLSALWLSTSATVPSAFLAQCDPALVSALASKIQGSEVSLGSDLRTGIDTAGRAGCDAVSVGLALEFVRTGDAVVREPTATISIDCPPCATDDAGSSDAPPDG